MPTHQSNIVGAILLSCSLASLSCQTTERRNQSALASTSTAVTASASCSGEVSKFHMKALPFAPSLEELNAPTEANASTLIDPEVASYLIEVCVGEDDSVTFMRLLKGGSMLPEPLVIANDATTVKVDGLKEAVFGDTSGFRLEANLQHQQVEFPPSKVILVGRLLQGIQSVIAYEMLDFTNDWYGLGEIVAGTLEIGEFAVAGPCAGVSAQPEPRNRVITHGTTSISLTQCAFNSNGVSGDRDIVVGVTLTDSAVPALANGVVLSKAQIFHSQEELTGASPSAGYAFDEHRHHGDCDFLFIEAAGAQYAINFGKGPSIDFCPAQNTPGLAGHDPGSTPDGAAVISWRTPGRAWKKAPLGN